MKKLLLLSKAQFNTGASYRRVEQLAMLFQSAGYRVVVYCVSDLPGGTTINQTDSIIIKSIWKAPTGLKQKLMSWLSEKKSFLKAIATESPDAICVYSTVSYGAAKAIKALSLKKGIPLFWDVVEERKPFQRLRIRSMLGYNIPNYLINSKLIDPSIRVVCVSKHLSDFFKRKGVKTFYLPITMSVPNSKPSCYRGAKIEFLYSGIPTGRDLLFEILKAFLLLPEDLLSRVSLTVCGLGTDKLDFSSAGIDERCVQELKTFTRFLGQISLDEMKGVLRKANFSLLLKDEDKIYSKAGFPTKISEALANGIVPICNLSSDLGDYLTDGFNSYICNGHTPLSMKEQLVRACQNFDAEYETLSENAYMTASKELNTKSFESDFVRFVC